MYMQRPNIVLIVMDAARFDHLSAYGYQRETTPFLEELASKGQTYLNCFSSSVWTIPSHASLFTGRHVYEHGVFGRELKLGSEFATLAETLSSHGYETLLITGNYLLSDQTGLIRGFRREFQFRRFSSRHPLSRYRIVNRIVAKIRLERYRDQGATWINRRLTSWARRYRKREPFFVFINYLDPHLPYKPPPAFRRMFLSESEEEKALAINQEPLPKVLGEEKLTSEELNLLKSLYDAGLAYVDGRIRELYESFEENGLNSDTIWIITADHGENIGEQGLLGHQFSILDTLTHVPLIVHSTASSGEPTKIEYLVQQKDLYDWIVKVAERSVSGTLPPLPKRDYCLYEYIDPPLAVFGLDRIAPDSVDRLSANYRAIRTERFKLVEENGRSYQLFDIVQDPLEELDLSSQEPQKVRELQAFLANHPREQRGGDGFSSKGDKEELKRQLRALGYL